MALGAVGALTAVTACGSPSAPAKPGIAVKPATATSVADFGGMDGLIEAARKEGELNVVALAPDWANYAEIIDTFSDKYGIKVNSAEPNAGSQGEIDTAARLKGSNRAPDVFDLATDVAIGNSGLFAPYKVRTWHDIPDERKAPDGAWFGDYGGYLSIGYDSAKIPPIASIKDLTRPDLKGKIALNGDPRASDSAFYGVVAAALGNGGSADNVKPGVEFFNRLAKAGNLTSVHPTKATIESGRTPVVLDWDYRNSFPAKEGVTWKVVIPKDATTGTYYAQAVNKTAPHPAAARLWQEFLYSDEGQNLFLKGRTRPIRLEAMQKAGTVDKAALALLPTAGSPVSLTIPQADTAKEYVSAHWAGN
ncbi:ABC transporter substrate-binding protein [Rhizohabitans arisaemae]|uniref:ABC transporter substrate-binding protein n=1 Tax=Rhizohabitans arisaemae TaxID=2720610 RepID=UPI0024B14C02|nr:extracellular solute-binding protein [Rhizohabitans arisaemae]